MEVANVKTDSLLEQILSSENLNEAFLQVKRNKGAEGVDGMRVNELNEHLKVNGDEIKEQIRKRKYKPQPVRRVEIPKPDGGVRNLGVPTVTDRFIQQAIAQVLTPIYEKQFHDNSYGFRSGRCAEMAIIKCLDMMNDGYRVQSARILTPDELLSILCKSAKLGIRNMPIQRCCSYLGKRSRMLMIIMKLDLVKITLCIWQELKAKH
jgi:retron-type reverse transcriptase